MVLVQEKSNILGKMEVYSQPAEIFDINGLAQLEALACNILKALTYQRDSAQQYINNEESSLENLH